MNTNKETKYVTSEEFDKIQETYEGKTEYVNGSVVLTSDVSDKHNLITLRIAAALMQFFSGKGCRVRSEKIEVIFDEFNKFKPDVFVVCDNPEMKGQSYITPPALVFEVLSRSTAPHDKVTKFNIYMKYGVKEYNLVEQNGFITQYTLIDGWYVQTNAFKLGEDFKSTAFENLKINMNYIFEED